MYLQQTDSANGKVSTERSHKSKGDRGKFFLSIVCVEAKAVSDTSLHV